MTNTQNIQVAVAVEETSLFGKMVKAEKLRFIASLVADNKEAVDFLETEAQRVENKNAKRTTKKSATQVENDELRQQVMLFMEDKGDQVFVADQLMKAINKEEFSAQKATALLKGLVDTFQLEKVPNVQVEVTNGETTKKVRKMGYKLA